LEIDVCNCGLVPTEAVVENCPNSGGVGDKDKITTIGLESSIFGEYLF